MIKVSFFPNTDGRGQIVFPLFHSSKADREFEKKAEPVILPDVARYIAGLRPQAGSQYVLVNAMGAGEYYGCFPAGTLIETHDGERAIEEVEPGTLVRTHRNRFRRVLMRTPKETGELCDLYVQGLPSNVPSLTATPNHELWVVAREDFRQAERRVAREGDASSSLDGQRQRVTREMEFSWVPVADLRPGDYVAEPFPLEEDPTALGDEKWNCPAVAFLMGLYAAGGWVSYQYDREGEHPASVTYVVPDREGAVAHHARAHAEALGYGLQDYKGEPGTSYRLQLCSSEFARLCAQHVGATAANKRLSSAVLCMPHGWQEVFLAAYAAIGSCAVESDKEEGMRRVTSASAALLRGMRLMLARLGLVASISSRYNKKASWYNGNPTYELCASGDGRGALGGYLHPDGFILSSVKKVEQYVWEGEVFDLTVEEDASFVASGIAVHNSNINGDHFPEAALIHCPDRWYGVPDVDRTLAKDWPYGFPTFYNAHPFLHHRNKDPSRAYGEVELATWNPRMKRVELVIRLDKDKCAKFGGLGVWDKLKMGQYPDVSMGSKVPFDTCFPAGTLIRTESGNKGIEQVVVGERVLADDGQYLPVTAVMKRSADDLFQIVALGLPTLTSTGNHPILLVRREEVRACEDAASGRRRYHHPDGSNAMRCRRCGAELYFQMTWTAASDVRPGDYMVVPAQTPTSRVNVPLPRARMLGYYLGGGYIIKQHTGRKMGGEYRDMGVGFSVSPSEEEHLRRLLSTLAEAGLHNEPRVYDMGGGRKAYVVSVCDQDAALWLQEMGGRGDRGKRLDEEVFKWPLEAKLELVGGYVDAGGSVDDDGQVCIASVNRGLLLDVQRLLLQERITAAVCHAEYGGGGDCWYLVLSAAQAQKLLGRSVKIVQRDVLWEPPQSFFWDGYWLTPVKSVEELDGEREVYNISVDKLEQYVAEGRIVHNCSICLDWDEYRRAQQTFDPTKHKHPGEAVLAFHKRLIASRGRGIRGLSITRRDYCEHTSKNMNKILPDGRKVFVYNDYPRFFDISFVFIGADKTAKVMMKIASDTRVWSLPSADLAERLGYVDEPEGGEMGKEAGAYDILKTAFLGKQAKLKRGEIEKHGPAPFDSKAVPLVTRNEPHLSRDQIDEMCEHPLGGILSSPTSMGILLRPREFQRIIIIKMGLRPLADELERDNIIFPRMGAAGPCSVLGSVIPRILSLLSPLFLARSALSPALDRRIAIIVRSGGERAGRPHVSSHPTPLLNKIGSAYSAYRQSVMDYWTQDQRTELEKAASGFGAHTLEYLKHAYWNEVGEP